MIHDDGAGEALGPAGARRGGRPPRRHRERFERRAERAIAGRHVFRYLSAVTLLLGIGAGILVWLIDRRDFSTVGDGMWWSLQTLTTVGYGDVVPHTSWGRVVGAGVMVVGVTFLSVLTATITSYFVSSDQEERAVEVEQLRGEDAASDAALLREILDRVTAIERALEERREPGTSP
ncbi:MAG TPA: potassium channel family protein [Baekduia sp.]